jgi:hypothetical protein
MSNFASGVRVFPTSVEKLREQAREIRKLVNLTEELFFPVLKYLAILQELKIDGFDFEIVDDNELPQNTFAVFKPQKCLLLIKNSIYEKAYNRYYDAFIGFRKLATPKVYYWQPAYNKEFTKKSEYLSKYLYLDDKIPARTDCGLVAEIDITDEDVLRNYEERTFVDDASTTAATYTTVGLSTSKESYILPDHIRQWIISRGYKVLDE